MYLRLWWGRSQCPHDLTCVCAVTRLLGLRVRIPPGAWLSVLSVAGCQGLFSKVWLSLRGRYSQKSGLFDKFCKECLYRIKRKADKCCSRWYVKTEKKTDGYCLHRGRSFLLQGRTIIWTYIQGDSGENVHILGIYIIAYRDIAVWSYKYKSIVNDNKERDFTNC
jgi:hypothetical protein